MEIKLYSENKVLDLSNQKVSIKESNSKVSDKMSTKYFFPFEIYVDEEFIASFGDYESYESWTLTNTAPWTLLFENYLSEAKLEIESIEGKYLTGQIDFGFEDLPNWDKKLSELSWEKFAVPDIHIYAKDICSKKYPQTNFNFPRIFTPKYSPEEKMWDAFNGYYNDLDVVAGSMKKNYVDSAGNIFNQNIIHPCIHFLYLLKKCFIDAGFTLKGDILTDPMFQDAWVFSGTEYFGKVSQFQNAFSVSMNDYYKTEDVINYTETINGLLFTRYYPRYFYSETINLDFNDKIFINGKFKIKVRDRTNLKCKIQINGNDIWSHDEFYWSFSDLVLPFSLELNVNHAELKFIIEGGVSNFNENYNVLEYDLKSSSIVTTGTPTSNDDAVVSNSNEIDLMRAVPDMKVGELINITRNWFNFGFTIHEKNIWMDRIGDREPTNIKNFERSEIKYPKRTFNKKRSFLLKHSDIDGNNQLNSIFYDKTGAKINKVADEDTTVIDINGYPLPIEKVKTNSPLTASVKRDDSSCLALVFYNGLINGENNAIAKPQATFPDLFYSNWEKWLRQRVNGVEFNWSFKIPAVQLDVKINDYIFCYNNIHIITSWTKDLSEGTYTIEITTETVY